MSRLKKILGGLEQAGKWGEDAILVLILTAMIFLASAQIFLRNFLDMGFIWGDEMLRMLVLWLAVAGAVSASRTDKHISIDVLNRFLPPRVSLAVKIASWPLKAGHFDKAMALYESALLESTTASQQDRTRGPLPPPRCPKDRPGPGDPAAA